MTFIPDEDKLLDAVKDIQPKHGRKREKYIVPKYDMKSPENRKMAMKKRIKAVLSWLRQNWIGLATLIISLISLVRSF